MSNLKCNYCGLAPTTYSGYAHGKRYCSPEHMNYDAKKDGWIPGGIDNRTTDEINCAKGKSHEGYIIAPAGAEVTSGGCGYCSRTPTVWSGSFKGKVYCCMTHMGYAMMKESYDTRSTEMKDGESGTHKGFSWH